MTWTHNEQCISNNAVSLFLLETGVCYDDSDCNMYDSNSVCHIPYAGCPEGSCQCGAGYYEDLGECYEGTVKVNVLNQRYHT